MEISEKVFTSLWTLAGEAAPWLLLGLIVAGLIRTLIPSHVLGRWLGGRSILAPLRAALIGTPLPLCSCSVMPVAAGLRRSGASKGSTVSFLIATPENGADSLAISYALLGPFMTIVRPIAAIISAITAGLLTTLATMPRDGNSECLAGSHTCHSNAEDRSCNGVGEVTDERSSLTESLRYALTQLYDDLIPWLALGLAVAAIFAALAPTEFMSEWGQGPLAMVVMVLVGVPMYICATASTPVAAAMLASGVSPGVTLVFLLAGPATNIGLLGFIRRELGTRTLGAYLLGVTLVPILLGLATDAVAQWLLIDISASLAHAHRITPQWLQIACVALLILLAIRPLRRLMLGR